MIDVVRDGHLLTLTLNRPEKRNAITQEMCQSLHDALETLEQDPELWCGIITGAGGHFSSGHDLTEPFNQQGTGFLQVYLALERLSKPMIAAVEGVCYAQGAGIALLCDLIVAHPDATFAWPNVRHGFSSVSGPAILARRLPLPLANWFLFTGEKMRSAEACEHRLVAAQSEYPLKSAEAWADEIMANAPLAVQALKQTMRNTAPLSLSSALMYANHDLQAVLATRDAQEGLAAFKEKREPKWEGR